MKYSGVVVLYNPNEKVIKNIYSYIENIDVLYAIDNSDYKNDKLIKKIKSIPKVIYIDNNGNKGIASALNVGAKKAIENKSDWLLTMDQDSHFSNKNDLLEMEKFIEEIAVNKIVQKICEIEINQIGVISPLHITKKNKYDLNVGVDEPIVVMTSGNLINLNIYQKIGGFDESLFIDCVDFDYCLNVKKHKYQIIRLNYIKLQHELGNITQKKFLNKTAFADNHSATRRYYIVRNRNYICDKYEKQFPNYCKLERKRTKIELIKVWLFEKEKVIKTRAMIKGYKDYKRGIKGKIQYEKK